MAGPLLYKKGLFGGLPPFEITHSMVIDAAAEGITVTDNDLYPRADDDLAFSIELWHKTPASLLRFRQIITLTDGSNNRIILQNSTTQNTLNFIITNSTQYIGRRSGAVISANTWYQYILTYSGNKTNVGCKIYLNASQVDSNNDSSGTYTGLPSLCGNFIVNYPTQIATYFGAGKYSLFRMWKDRELTSSEASTLYNSGDPIEAAGSLASNLKLELLVNNNANARIGTDGVFVGSPTFDNSDLP